jgi:hypothetical protein
MAACHSAERLGRRPHYSGVADGFSAGLPSQASGQAGAFQTPPPKAPQQAFYLEKVGGYPYLEQVRIS